MVAISLQGKSGTYIFSVREKGAKLPPCSGFYLLVTSDDKYGIRNRKVLKAGYAENLEQEQANFARMPDATHIYLMPDFENTPENILTDLQDFMMQTPAPEQEKGQATA